MKNTWIIAPALILGGCAFGQSANYSAASMNIPAPAAASSVSIAIAVHDRRPYVLSGGKPERFIGLIRGGFGNPFDANTTSGAPLASEMRDAIFRALKDKGYTVSAVNVSPRDAQISAREKLIATGSKRLAMVTLTEWKSDTMYNTELHYDVTLAIFNEKGEQLATNTLRGKDNIGTGGLRATMNAYPRKIEALFDDPKVAAALKL